MNVWDMTPDTESPAISPIASAVPDLPSPDTERVTRSRTDVTVPTDATQEMNLAGELSGNSAEETDAPTVDVMPENHPATAPIATPFSPGTAPTGSRTLSDCLGMRACPVPSRRTGIPNRPVSRGIITPSSPRIPSKDAGTVMHIRPSSPETQNATGPQTPDPRLCSETSRIPETSISTSGVSESRASPAGPDSRICSGTAMSTAVAAPTRLPIAAALTASMPLPFSSRRCPGSTDTASSPSGAPMNTDGTKSTKECTTDADMMQQHTAAAAPSAPRWPENAAERADCEARSIAARVLTWIPGAMPLKSPRPAPASVIARQNPTRVGSMAGRSVHGQIRRTV